MVLGKLVTWEGGEFAGKNKHNHLTAALLSHLGYNVNNSFWEPGSTPKAELLRIVVKNKIDTDFVFPNGFLETLDFNEYNDFFSKDELSDTAKAYLRNALSLSKNPYKREMIEFVLYGELKKKSLIAKALKDIPRSEIKSNEKIHDVFLKNFFTQNPLSAKTQEYLFFAARNILYHNYIEKSLRSNDFTFINRSLDSTTVYQGRVLNPERVELIREENLRAVKGIVPDLTIFLDIPVKEMFRRLTKTPRGSYTDFFDGKKAAFHEKVKKGYEQELAHYISLPRNHKEYGRIVRIDADADLEVVHSSIVDLLSKKFSINTALL